MNLQVLLRNSIQILPLNKACQFSSDTLLDKTCQFSSDRLLHEACQFPLDTLLDKMLNNGNKTSVCSTINDTGHEYIKSLELEYQPLRST